MTTSLNDQKKSTKNIETLYALSSMQEGMLLHSLLDAETKKGVYHQQLIWNLDGKLDISSFTKAWEKILFTHSVLRTGFFWREIQKPVQVVFRDLPIHIQFVDWTHLSQKELEQQLQDFLKDDRENPLSLDQPPLMRLILFQRSSNQFTFVWSHHHIILDGWSVAIVLGQVIELYEKIIKQPNASFSLPKITPFVDYIKWLQKQDISLAEQFWRNELKGFQARISFGDRILSSPLAVNYLELEIILSKSLTESLTKLIRQERWTLATILEAAWALVLGRFSSTKDVVFGVTISGRPSQLKGSENMVGLFINTLPLRILLDPKMPLRNWIHEIQKKQHNLKEWEHIPLSNIQEWSEVPRGQQLFDSIFVLENYPVTADFSDTSIKITSQQPIETTNYPLTLSAGLIDSGRVSIKLNYNHEIYSCDMANSLLEYMEILLVAFSMEIEDRVADLPQISAKQEKKLTSEFQGKTTSLQTPRTLSDSFEIYAEMSPNKIAVVDENGSYTYAEINQKANQLCHALHLDGIKENDVVAIGIGRSADLIIAIFAVWKAGAAYIPLDLFSPPKRILDILTKSSPNYLLTVGKQEWQSNGIPSLDIGNQREFLASLPTSNPKRKNQFNSLAYIIFTSGSTGIPKAVMVEHRSLMNIAQSWAEEYDLLQLDLKLLQIANFSFDVFVGDLARCYFNGGTLVFCLDHVKLELPILYKLLRDHRISIFESTPALILPLMDYIFQNQYSLIDLKVLILGSDVFKQEEYCLLKERFGKNMRIINSYGITEATIDTSYFEAKQKELVNFSSIPYVPLGKPFHNMEFYILDENLNMQPIGIKGEIFIGGMGLARGYYQDPGLTAEKYLPHPFKIGQRLYRTGDFGKWLQDGNLEFLGRSDEQVKIRGFRVSLAEINRTIESYPDIKQAIITEQKIGSVSSLCGYYSAHTEIDPTALRSFLHQSLPQYMIPTHFIQLDNFPLSPNGKIDRKSLPLPQAESHLNVKGEPKNDIERTLYCMWKEILHLETIDTHASFFELGGNSLLILTLFNKINSQFQLNITVADLFSYHTIAQLGQYLSSKIETIPKKTLEQIMDDLETGKITVSKAQEQMELIGI